MRHVSKTFLGITEKHDWFDYPILAISDDYAFATEEELTLDNMIISEQWVYLEEYSFPSIEKRFSELDWDGIVKSRGVYYDLIKQKAASLPSKPSIIMVEGALIQRQADIDLIARVLEVDSVHVVLMDLGYDIFLKSPRWQERQPPRPPSLVAFVIGAYRT